MSDTTDDAPVDEATASARANDELFRTIARLKLRVEVCLKRDRPAAEYREALFACLADVDDIVRATSGLLGRAK